MTQPAPHNLTAIIGASRFPVQSWEQVSTAYRRAISVTGLGAHDTPRCLIMDGEGYVAGYVSYNGRVWLEPEWREGLTPIYDPVKMGSQDQ